MPKYEVTYTIEQTYTVEVEADDADEASGLVEYGDGDLIDSHDTENSQAERKITEVKLV
jgi:hypothetical protein